ncbi:MAG: RodZ domain-containing protein [Bdellovibrionia bacterium]
MTQMDENLTLGQYLRKEREKRGLSIEQVASATKIGVRQLHALESDQYSDLPAKPFIRGFVTSYSRFVGLDHKEVLTHFNSFIDSKACERPNREGGHSGYAFEKREGNEQSRMILGIVMGSFIVLGGIAMVVLKPSLHHHKHSHADKLRAAHSPSPGPSDLPSGVPLVGASASPLPSGAVAQPSGMPSQAAVVAASASPQVTASAAPTPVPTIVSEVDLTAMPTPSPTSASDPLNSGLGLKASETVHRLVIKAKQTVWVRYRVDNKIVMQFPLKQDKVLVLRARQGIILQVGNPEHATISYNGGAYKLISAAHTVTRQNDATLFFPPQLAEKTENPFPGSKPISGRNVPSAPAPQPSPTST